MNKDKNDELKYIGNNIQLARLKMGFTQETLAEKCYVSTNYISSLERGITSGSIPLIIDICNILHITPNYIFNHSLKIEKLNNNVDIIDPELLIYYSKLKDENKSFVNQTIVHLYGMQKKR